MNLEIQIACVLRELALRASVYPKLVARGRMKPETAEKEMLAMKAVFGTLKELKAQAEMRDFQQQQRTKEQEDGRPL